MATVNVMVRSAVATSFSFRQPERAVVGLPHECAPEPQGWWRSCKNDGLKGPNCSQVDDRREFRRKTHTSILPFADWHNVNINVCPDILARKCEPISGFLFSLCIFLYFAASHSASHLQSIVYLETAVYIKLRLQPTCIRLNTISRLWLHLHQTFQIESCFSQPAWVYGRPLHVSQRLHKHGRILVYKPYAWLVLLCTTAESR